jgi:hypothetical protein
MSKALSLNGDAQRAIQLTEGFRRRYSKSAMPLG